MPFPDYMCGQSSQEASSRKASNESVMSNNTTATAVPGFADHLEAELKRVLAMADALMQVRNHGRPGCMPADDDSLLHPVSARACCSYCCWWSCLCSRCCPARRSRAF